MGVKVYISGISGNKEVKKHQQRVMMILDSKNVAYEVIDITEPGKEDEKEFMQSMSNARDSKHPLPPQIFNDEDYCGDYEDFDLANEIDELEKFLKIISVNDDSVDGTLDNDNETLDSHSNIRQNGNTSSREASTDKDVSIAHSESELNDRPQSTVDETNEKSKSVDDDDVSVKSQIEDGEQMDESTDKNEEKSDDQEKEE